MAQEVKSVKDIGWDKLSLSKEGFKGAVQSFRSEKGATVALAFNMHEAFVIEDDQGIFNIEDIFQGIIKDPHFDIEATGEIDGAVVVAWEQDQEVTFDDLKLSELGINDFGTRQSLKDRLILLSRLDKLVDMPM